MRSVRRRFILTKPLLAVLAAVVGSWGLLFAIFPPAMQDFPLIDDWSFAHLAFRFARGEAIRYDGWPSMPLIGQFVWAAPFVRVFGETNVAVRLSTLVLTLLALIALFDLYQSDPGVSRRTAAFATALVAFNPWFFLMSGTFMSDVPALAFSLIGLAVARRAARSRGAMLLLAGTAVTLMGTITRQNANATPFAVAFLFRRNVKDRWIFQTLGAILPLAAGLGAAYWFGHQPNINPRTTFDPTTEHIVDVFLRHGYIFGFTVVPMLLLNPRRLGQPGFLCWLAVFAGGTLLWLDHNNRWYRQPYFEHIQPLIGDMIRHTGIYFHAHRPEGVGFWAKIAATVGGIFGLAALFAGPGGRVSLAGCAKLWVQVSRRLSQSLGRLSRVSANGEQTTNRSGLVNVAEPSTLASGSVSAAISTFGGFARIGESERCLIMFSLLQGFLLSLTRPVYDRYMIVLLPLVALRAIPRRGSGSRLKWGFGLTGLLLVVVMSVTLEHDWLAWNAAKWEIGTRAVARGIDPVDIEGGFEWDGWHATELHNYTGRETPAKNLTTGFTRQVFPRVSGRYSFDLRGIPPTLPRTLVDSIPYQLRLTPGVQRMELYESR
jgi:4-amino-4-deoxy-L-arabinose transferase-like glycosyltransferase